MTQTTAHTAATPSRPADMLFNLIVILLAPMFLTAGGGDIRLAQLAAIETINGYRTQNSAGLIAVAQIIAFGLAALGSLGLSMEDGLSIPMTLRLRGNAVALNRSAEQNRRFLNDSRLQRAESDPATMSPEEFFQALLANQGIEDAIQTDPPPQTPPQAASVPTPPQAAAPEPATIPGPDKQRRTTSSAAISGVADECAAGLPFLPPLERKLASLKVAAMSSSVTALPSGDPDPEGAPASR